MDNVLNGTDRTCHVENSNKRSSAIQNQSQDLCNMNCFNPTSLQLMTLDIQLLIEKLDDVCPGKGILVIRIKISDSMFFK